MNYAPAIYVRPLYAELMGTTALTPTQHKGGFAKVAGIAASIAIGYASFGIGTALAASFSINATLASTLVGGVLGAGLAAATGGNILAGAAGGAIGGFSASGGFSGIGDSISSAFGTPASGVNGFTAAQIGSVGPNLSTAGLTSAPGGLGLPLGFDAGVTGFDSIGGLSFDPTGGGASFIPGVSAPSFVTPAGTPPGVFVAGGSGNSTLTGNIGSDFLPRGEAPGISFGEGSVTPLGGGEASNLFNPASSGVTPLDFRGTDFGPPLRSATAAEPGFFDGFGDKVIAGAKEQFTGENLGKRLGDFGGKFVTSQLSEAFADKVPVSPEEQQRLDFLDQQRAKQAGLQDQKERLSNTFLAQASTISPFQRGLEAFALANNRFERGADEERRRAISSGGRSATAQASLNRKINLNRSRIGAFQEGQEAGTREQERKVAQAAALLPDGSSLAGAAAEDLAASQLRFLRLQQEQKNAGDLFGGLLLPDGADSKEKLKKVQEGIA